jgi:excisionase family DNA binding protein
LESAVSAEAEVAETTTFVPDHPEGLASILSFLAAHEQRRGELATPSYALVGVDEHDRIELPEEIHRALTKVVAALHAGKAVTIAPQTTTLTTQQAADLLGVSRPTIVRLINDGVLQAERVGNRRRLLLDNVLTYREERRNRQYDALAATSIDIDSNGDSDKIREQLREARRVIAARRRKAASPI